MHARTLLRKNSHFISNVLLRFVFGLKTYTSFHESGKKKGIVPVPRPGDLKGQRILLYSL